MPRDYKNRSGAAKRGKPAKSGGAGWRNLLIGLTVGLVVALGVHLHHRDGERRVQPSEQPRVAPAPASPPAAPAKPAPTAEPTEPGRPRFEFYRLLPEMQVVVPEEEQRPPRERPEPSPPPQQQRQPERPTAPASQPPLSPGQRYLLQAGSFRSFDDADRLKAQLALLGVEANIQTVEIRAGETWHRVRIGPFTDGGELGRIRQRLESNGVEAIVLRLGS